MELKDIVIRILETVVDSFIEKKVLEDFLKVFGLLI
jgi:hypothetical protein